MPKDIPNSADPNSEVKERKGIRSTSSSSPLPRIPHLCFPTVKEREDSPFAMDGTGWRGLRYLGEQIFESTFVRSPEGKKNEELKAENQKKKQKRPSQSPPSSFFTLEMRKSMTRTY